jgi:coronin-1B/1C/6
MTSGEGNFLAVNRKFVAYAGAGGGGPVYVIPIDQPGRGMRDLPGINVHKGKVWDWDFHPFHNNIIAMGADDCRATITVFPETGLSDNITEASQSFEGHEKKVTHVFFSRVANLLGTASFDGSVRMWDIEKAACVSTYNPKKGQVHSVSLFNDSGLVVMASKDKNVSVYDPRNPDTAIQLEAFGGSKSVKVQHLSKFGWVFATGFDRSAKRQIKMWDLRNPNSTIYSQNLDAASSILIPHWDDDLGIMYTVGKGEGTISYYEVVNDATKLYYLSMYRHTTPQRGGAFMPKYGMDVFSCEVQRFFKLTKDSIIPLRFTVPRKAGADVFQSDIFPDCFAHKEALSVDDWQNGQKADPVTVSMDPAVRPPEEASSAGMTFTARKTYDQLEQELTELKRKYADVKQRLAAADPSYVPSDDEKSSD